MRLYTEEEIKRAIDNPVSFNMETDEFIASLTPVKLPSDEEMEKENPFVFGSHVFGTRDLMVWELGAKWMRDKIQGGNNEQ